MIPQRIARLARYERRFTRFASPRYWRERGMKLLYLPYASDPALFHPVPHAKKTWRWAFCGTIYQRHLIPQLTNVSRAREVSFHVAAKELGTAIDPLLLNEFYNAMSMGPNEHWHGVFGRELNQRVFDLGMAGVFQICDMEWLARDLVGPYAAFYAGKAADRKARRLAVEMTLDLSHSFPAETPPSRRHDISGARAARAARGAVVAPVAKPNVHVREQSVLQSPLRPKHFFPWKRLRGA